VCKSAVIRLSSELRHPVRFPSIAHRKRFSPCVILLLFAVVSLSSAQNELSPALRASIDEIAQQVLATTGVPSASLAVVKDGKIAYLQAYGQARLDPRSSATPAMRYSIGSISKQFTAAAILMLAEEGKLSLDDPVSKYVHGLTRGNEVKIRELLRTPPAIRISGRRTSFRL